jgi:hypothetical protein
LANGDPQYDDLEKLAEGPVIAVPAITLDGDADGVAPASDGTSYVKKFTRRRTHRIICDRAHRSRLEDSFVCRSSVATNALRKRGDRNSRL